MAEWAGAETAKEAANSKRKIEELHTILADTLWWVEESEAREIQLGEQLKAAEVDTESYRRRSKQSLEELRLEKNANKEATRVSMEANHYLLEEKSALQKQVIEVHLEAKEAQEMLQSCKLEIDHLQHKLDRRERQLAAAEGEARQAKEQSTKKQEEIDSLMASLADMKLQWNELSELETPSTELWWETLRPWKSSHPSRIERKTRFKLGERLQ